ncbi:glucoamylase family protein [Sphingomonas sp. ASV193]|uniref:glucoamylase family protein n=1 Tax=Sphingomonas sp. ASV193 TaxID=3144405 RepID=UPI0032E85752
MTQFDRRSLLAATPALALATPALGRPARFSAPALIDDIERRTFDWFWQLGRPDNGLVPDRWPTPSFCSIAAVGFALTAYPLGVERGWISRSQARARTLATLRFFDRLPHGAAASGVAGHNGFFYHFLHLDTGLRYRDTELSSVDSTLLFLGMLFAAGWFAADHPDEAEIRRLATDIVERADWRWFQRGRGDVSMGWQPDKGFLDRGWTAYNEGMMVAIMALGATRHPVGDEAWLAWLATLPPFWRGEGPTRHIAFAPLFGHQYSHTWIDFRGIRDSVTRKAGFDYFENSRRATYADRAYCLANPMGWDGYSKDLWGLTACDGPGNFSLRQRGVVREVHGYAARGPVGQPDGLDDGTIAPTAALGSIAFAPEIVIPAARALVARPGVYRRYGFADSFNPSVRDPSLKLETGTIDPRHGWVATDYLGIDQGPILAMIANWRRDAVWRVMRRSPTIRRGLKRAGFTGGWLER